MAMLAAEHAAGLNGRSKPRSTSSACRPEAASPSNWRPIILARSGGFARQHRVRLGSAGRRIQRQVAARVRAGASRPALALLAADLVPPWRGRYVAALTAGAIGPQLFADPDLQDLATTIEAEDEFDLAACGVVCSPTLLIAGGEDRFYSASCSWRRRR